MHQQKAFLMKWNTLIMFPVLSEIEIKPKLTIWRKPLSEYALVTCRVGCTKPFNRPWSFHCLCFKFQCESVHVCGIRTCLCGTAVWPVSDSFSILSPESGRSVCQCDYRLHSILPPPRWASHTVVSEAVQGPSLTVFHHDPLSPDLDECANTHVVHYASSHSAQQALWVPRRMYVPLWYL